MKEKLFIKIYINGEHITNQDVTGFTLKQIADMMAVKEEYGLECSLKRVFINEEV